MEKLKKLNTHEDVFYIHKIMGMVVLTNYIYRFYLLFTRYDMELTTPSSLVLLGAHLLLSLSSLFFRISNTRNRVIPIIYPEFRLHNIIFAVRSINCCLFFYYFQRIYDENSILYIKHIHPHNYSVLCNMGVCFLTMKCADIITGVFEHSTPKTTTMRNMPYNEIIPDAKLQMLKQMYSLMQLYATYYMIGNINSAFTPMFAIQLSSFLMTLVKKSIIPPMWWHPLYYFALLSNSIAFLSLTPEFIIKMNIACSFFSYWRFTLGKDKYIGWLIVFAFHYLVMNEAREYYFPVVLRKIMIIVVVIYHYVKYGRFWWPLYSVKTS